MRHSRGVSSRQRSQTDSVAPAIRLWSDVIKPALYIGIAGAGAVLYLIACARVSVIECDLGRLERIIESERTAELYLQRQLTELRHAERIQAHIAERGLQPPRGHRHLRIGNVPVSLCEALIDQDADHDRWAAAITQSSGRVDGPLYASAGYLRDR